MMLPVIIPDYQPIPLPAPLWLLQTLLVVGFLLHILPMNVAFGGGITSAWLLATNKDNKESFAYRLGKNLSNSLPLFISFAITQGIVPLLFLQLIYGPLYYTSSILMAVLWISILLLLMLGYYAAYTYKVKAEALKSWGPWLLVLSTVLFGIIGFLFTNNMTLMLSPDKWSSLMHGAPSGFLLNLSDPQVIPRFVHFVVAAFAVTGLCVGCFGVYYHHKDPAYSKWLIQTGSGIFLVLTLLQVGVGFWFLFALPPEIVKNFMGQEQLGSISFMGSMVLSLVALLGTLLAWKDGSKNAFLVGLVGAVGTLLGMSVMRHMIRVYSTQSFLHPENLPVHWQWDLLVPFLILAALLVIYLVWLCKLTWKAYNPEAATSQKA